jgi:hypothetical protein
MSVLIGCEKSGVVRRAFRAAGHDAWSCDLLPPDDDGNQHHQGDVLFAMKQGWDLAIFHPPCNYLTVSVNGPITHGCSLYTAKEGQRRRKLAIAFFMALVNAPIPRVCVENPIGIMSTRYRKPDQIIQPYHFGHDASKATCLWLKNLPPLAHGRYVPPRMVCKCGNVYPWADNAHGCPKCGDTGARPRWANQTNGGQNKLSPSPTRSAERAETYPGIAKAMVKAWGS